MFDYHNCIVPDIKLGKRIYVWVAYAKEPPYLPIAVEDTPEKLAQKIGVSESAIRISWWRFRHGRAKKSRYYRVKTGFDLNWQDGQ